MEAFTGCAHLGHGLVAAMGDTRVGGARPPEPTAAPGTGVVLASETRPTAAADEPAEYAGITRADEADIGFPQSMQNRDMGSLSRPQKAQITRGVTV